MERVTHISFATWQMSNAAEALVASAYAHGVENVWVYCRAPTIFIQRCHDSNLRHQPNLKDFPVSVKVASTEHRWIGQFVQAWRLAKRDRVMDSLVGIYQPFYKPGLFARLDRGFIPLNWMSNPEPAKRELLLHQYILSEGIHKRHSLTGMLSPKFFSKTNLSSQQVYDWIANNPGHDVYLINGTPYVPYANWNTIERNNGQTPTFEIQMRSLCRIVGLHLPESFSRQTNSNTCSCNYWIASQAFWERWQKDVIRPLSEMAERDLGAGHLFEISNYPAPAGVYKLTLIYERLIDHYIAHNQIDAIYYPWVAESVLALNYHPSISDYLKKIVPRVDAIDARGSWTETEKLWLRERYSAVSLGFAPAETLSADPLDHDLPRRYPMHDNVPVGEFQSLIRSFIDPDEIRANAFRAVD